MFEKVASPLRPLGGGNSKIFVIFIPKIGELIQFDDHIFQMGWFNHQVARCCWKDVFFTSSMLWSKVPSAVKER